MADRCVAGRPGRVEGGLLALAVIAFVVGSVAALAATDPAYSWYHSMISDLGSGECVQRAAHRTCSPRAAWFNAGLALSGICVLLATARVRSAWGGVLSTAMAALGSGLVLVAAVPSDVSHGVHMAGAVLALPVPAAGLLVSGIHPGSAPRGDGRGSGRLIRAVLGAVALILCLDHLPGDAAAPIPRGLAEATSVAALLGFLLLEALRGWLRVGSGAQVAEARPHARPATERTGTPHDG